MEIYIVDQNGENLRIIAESKNPTVIPDGWQEVPSLPDNGKQKWNGTAWDALPPPTKIDQLSETENVASLARKVEDLIDYIENGTPLSSFTKTWESNRKNIRG